MTQYIGASIYRSSKQGRSGSLLPRAELWVKPETGMVTDGAADFVAADRSWLTKGTNWIDPAWDQIIWFSGWAKARSNHGGCAFRFGGPSGYFIAVFNTSGGFQVNAPGGVTAHASGTDWIFFFTYYDPATGQCFAQTGSDGRSGIGHPNPPPTGTQYLTLGQNAGNAQWFDGYLDSFVVGNAVSVNLAPAEIANYLYNHGKGRIALDVSSEFRANSGARNFFNLNEEKGVRSCSWTNMKLNEGFSPIVSPTFNNGGFETPDPSEPTFPEGWTCHPNLRVPETKLNSEEQYAGEYCFEVPLVENAPSLGGYFDRAGALKTQGKLYSVSYYAKHDGADGVSINVSCGGSSLVDQFASPVTNRYERKSGIAKASFNNSPLRFRLPTSPIGRLFYFDNVEVRATEILSAPGIAAGQPQDQDRVESWHDNATGRQLAFKSSNVASRFTYRTKQIDDWPALESDEVDDLMVCQLGRTLVGDRSIFAIINPVQKTSTAGNSGLILTDGTWTPGFDWFRNSTSNAGSLQGLMYHEDGTVQSSGVLPAQSYMNRFMLMKLAVDNNPVKREFMVRLENTFRRVPATKEFRQPLSRIELRGSLVKFKIAELVLFNCILWPEQERELLRYFKDKFPSLTLDPEVIG